MSNLVAPIIDVVIPVYNAPELTLRCIDSVVTHLGASIRTIHIQDDASGVETRAMLDSLSYPQLRVYHAAENQGYGKSVNDAVARSDAEYVLVLNSDIEVSANFLPPLCNALVADPKLAVISPSDVPGFLGGTQSPRRQPDSASDLHTWIAVCALSPFPLDDETALALRQKLRLAVSSVWDSQRLGFHLGHDFFGKVFLLFLNAIT